MIFSSPIEGTRGQRRVWNGVPVIEHRVDEDQLGDVGTTSISGQQRQAGHHAAAAVAHDGDPTLTPEACIDLVRAGDGATLRPLAGGIDPAIGWETLRLVVEQVMPALAS